MKTLFTALRTVIRIIALLVFAAAIVLAIVGIVGFIRVFSYLGSSDQKTIIISIVIALLKAVDLFLISIVLFVFSLGIMILFNNKTDAALPVNLPEWLRVKNFMQLKVILWEAILTTILISYVTTIAEKRINGHDLGLQDMFIPATILLIALSLYFLKKGENQEHR